MTAKRILLAVGAALAVAVIAMSTGIGGSTLIAWAQDILPPAAPAPPALGNPTNLTATTGGRGEVNVSFSPAVGATVHWIWRVKPDNTGGDWVKGEADGYQTVTGLTPGQAYYFIVIAGRPQATGGVQWSSWSNWGGAVAGTVGTSTSSPPSTPIFPANPVNGDYDADDDGLIEIRSIAQLDAIRHDLDGDGVADAGSADDDANTATATAYAAAFPSAATGMGCPDAGCAGYELANDLDFHTAGSIAWDPVGYHNSDEDYAYFTADFDGNHRTISNLVINNRSGPNETGLFGVVGSGGKVRRVGLEAVNIIGYYSVGGLAGWNYGNISDSYVKGSVSGRGFLGALVGGNEGTVTKSYADARVHGYGDDPYATGGLVGQHNAGVISNSYAEGSVSGNNAVGGLVGFNHSVITASYATATVSGNTYYVGGLVGYSSGSISVAYATGAVSGSVSFLYSYPIGGLVGYNSGSISDAYAIGATSGDTEGGLVGTNNGGHTHFSYWDTETSGLTVSAVGVGLPTAQLQTPTSNTEIYARWNPNQWDFGTAKQYPVLDVAGLSVAAQRDHATTGSGGAAAADRAALVAFYEATGGDSWSDKTNWLSDKPPGEWHGVTTNADGRVTGLSLPDNNLRGEIPEELGNLTLRALDLSYNKLTGNIYELAKIESLTDLNLAGNRMSGLIPPWIGGITELKTLDLSENADRGKFGHGVHRGFSGWLPKSMGNLHSLSELDLSGNSFGGELPEGTDDFTDDPAEVLLNIVQCEKESPECNSTQTIDVDLRDNLWSGEEADFWLNFTGNVVQVARGEFGNAYVDFAGETADSVIKLFLYHESAAGRSSRFNALATKAVGAVSKANFASQFVDPLKLFGQDATVQEAMWDVFIGRKSWDEVGNKFLTSWGIDPENICWGGLVSANCGFYESLPDCWAYPSCWD